MLVMPLFNHYTLRHDGHGGIIVLLYLQLFLCPVNHEPTCVHCSAALLRGTSSYLRSSVTSGSLIGSGPVIACRATG
jgi:hypothetical protein